MQLEFGGKPPACPNCGAEMASVRFSKRALRRMYAEQRRMAREHKLIQAAVDRQRAFEKQHNISVCPTCKRKIALPCRACLAEKHSRRRLFRR